MGSFLDRVIDPLDDDHGEIIFLNLLFEKNRVVVKKVGTGQLDRQKRSAGEEVPENIETADFVGNVLQ